MRNSRCMMAGAIAVAFALGSSSANAQSRTGGIVEEALKGVRQDQERDSARVKRMVDEAVQGAERAPSGEDTVNPMAPATLRPLVGEDAPGVLPVGYKAAELVGRPVDDGTGERIGLIRGLVLDESSGVARAMVEFEPLFGQEGKTSAVPIEELTTATARGQGYVMELTTVEFERMPAYSQKDSLWQRVDG